MVEELPWHTSAELVSKRFQHRDEEQSAEDRALMRTNSHAKLTVLTVDPYAIPCIGVHALKDTHKRHNNPSIFDELLSIYRNIRVFVY